MGHKGRQVEKDRGSGWRERSKGEAGKGAAEARRHSKGRKDQPGGKIRAESASENEGKMARAIRKVGLKMSRGSGMKGPDGRVARRKCAGQP